jgi:TolA-binding protein
VAEIRREADKEYGQKVKELEAKLKDAETRINELQGQKDVQSSTLILSPEQQKEVDRFRKDRDQIRKDLRAIKHSRDKDIEALGGKLKFADILLIPILLVVVASGLAMGRTSRAKAIRASAGART